MGKSHFQPYETIFKGVVEQNNIINVFIPVEGIKRIFEEEKILRQKQKKETKKVNKVDGRNSKQRV